MFLALALQASTNPEIWLVTEWVRVEGVGWERNRRLGWMPNSSLKMLLISFYSDRWDDKLGPFWKDGTKTPMECLKLNNSQAPISDGGSSCACLSALKTHCFFSWVHYMLFVLSVYQCPVCPAPPSLFVHLSDHLVFFPGSLASAQISDGQFLSAGWVQLTAHEGEFGRAINSPHSSLEGKLCQGEDLSQGPDSVMDISKTTCT